MNRARFHLALLGCVLLLSGCADFGSKGVGETPVLVPKRSYQENYNISLLDQITVTYQDPGRTPVTLTVTTPGTVEYPPDSGKILLLVDKTPEEAIHLIRQSSDHPIKDIAFTEYQGNRITVTGEVNIQTTFDIPDGPTHVLDAVAAAGGFTPLADQSSLWLTRHNAGSVEVYEIDAHAIQTGQGENLNILLKPGDRLYVPRSFL